METALTIALAALIFYLSITIIRSWYLQRQFKTSLQLNPNKNNAILKRQAGGLLVSVAMFVLVLNPSLLNPQLDQAPTDNMSKENARAAFEMYTQEGDDMINDLQDENLEVIGVVNLSDIQYVLIEVDETYYLIDELNDEVIPIDHIP